MKRRLITIPLLLAGCAAMQPTPLTGERDVIVYPHFARHTQTLVDVVPMIATLDMVPYIQADDGTFAPISSINGLPVAFGDPNMLKITQASPSITSEKPFVFRRLKFGKKYRIYGKAYNSSNALISQDSSSYLELATNWEERPSTTNLPVYILTSSPAATTSITIYNDERSDFIKTSLYLSPSNVLIAADQTSRRTPVIQLSNLQGNTNYRFGIEVYKNGSNKTSNNIYFSAGNDNEPAAMSMTGLIGYSSSTLAGSTDNSSGTTDGALLNARFYIPRGIDMDASGNLYVADCNNNSIRKISTTAVTTIAGSTAYGYQDGTGTAAQFKYPRGVVVDHSGNLFVADINNHCIRKIDTNGVVTTFAGSTTPGFQEGDGTAAMFNSPTSIAKDAQDNLYVTDANNYRIRKITPQGTVTTYAGCTSGYQDGTGTAAQFSYMYGLAVDKDTNIYVADSNNNRIRKIDSNRVVTTLAGDGQPFSVNGVGTQAEMNYPVSVACDSYGNIYFSDNSGISKIIPDSHYVTQIYGTSNCYGLLVDTLGKVYAASTGYNRIVTYQ